MNKFEPKSIRYRGELQKPFTDCNSFTDVDFSNYIPPINLYEDPTDTQIDNEIVRVVRNIGIDVDKKELIRALENDRNEYQRGYWYGSEAARPRWISATEFPRIDPDRSWRCACEFSVDVVGFDGRNIFKAYYNFEDKVWLNGNIEEECHNITHWMYMDDLPEEEA